MTNEIYVTDIETTGTDPKTDEIIEIGSQKWINPQPSFGVEGPDEQTSWVKFSALVRPNQSVPAETSAIHHLTDWHLSEALDLSDVLTDFTYKMHPRPIFAAHNSTFEASFLEASLAEKGVKPRWICTYKLALHLFPDAPSHSNSSLFYFLGVFKNLPEFWESFLQKNRLHRAWPDAYITTQLLNIFLNYVSIPEALRISSAPALLPKVNFTKDHRGKKWAQMDESFLTWVLHPDRDFDADVIHTAQYWLDKAKQEDE
ncbi:exodeoxyribonuclease X [Litorimonas taeanensis]|uniref:Exodeoxyribonuclease X n=1 Tax=Litorimonas taeanensis TaxID=568099 RepID=A0A420WD71_9PROT|nr:3'-5' exonuclease [Litorimonas taeanensis]RKQ68984.1 exodeoxyribonuclease X [Litorimonas taeanensis]